MFNIDDADSLFAYQVDLTVALPLGSYRVGLNILLQDFDFQVLRL